MKQPHEYSELEIDQIEKAAQRRAIREAGLCSDKIIPCFLFCFLSFFAIFILVSHAMYNGFMSDYMAVVLAGIPLVCSGVIFEKIRRNYWWIIKNSNYGKNNYCCSCSKWLPWADVHLWSSGEASCDACAEKNGLREYAVCLSTKGKSEESNDIVVA